MFALFSVLLVAAAATKSLGKPSSLNDGINLESIWISEPEPVETRHKRSINIGESVEQYSARMQSDPQSKTESVNENGNPVTQYTIRPASGTRGPTLPLVVKAVIRAQHIRESNSRDSSAIPSAARTNCQRMGMNTNRADGNNDAVGHLVAYKHGGPTGIYNFAPQTNRLNVGSANAGPLISKSVWATSEREITEFVQKGGRVELTIVVIYGAGTRPIGYGTSEKYYDANNNLFKQIPSYFYSNNPDKDSDCGSSWSPSCA